MSDSPTRLPTGDPVCGCVRKTNRRNRFSLNRWNGVLETVHFSRRPTNRISFAVSE